MKHFVLLLLMLSVVAFLVGCAGSEEDGPLQLDGPILEGINQNGELEFNGAVVNTGDTAVGSAVVIIILKDKQGKVIEATSTPLTSGFADDVIPPSERVFFTVSVPVDPAKIFSKDVEIFSESAENP